MKNTLNKKNYCGCAIISFYNVYIIESVNLDDGDSAIMWNPHFFF